MLRPAKDKEADIHGWLRLKIIRERGEVLGIMFSQRDIQSGLQFVTDSGSFLQVGTWNYESGKKLAPHIHNKVVRTTNRTQEMIHVMKGRLKAVVFSEDEREVDALEMSAGDTLVLLAGGHGYQILENGTRVLEVKNGPYVGPDADRRRFGAVSE